jgi:hypothetical protein
MRRKLLKALAGAVALAGIGSALLTGTANAATLPNLNVKLLSPNGLCLTSLNASVGQFLPQTGCSAAHAFVFDQIHANIFVQGHPGACIASGDPGNPLVIEPCSNGRSVLRQDATLILTVAGVSVSFERLLFINFGTYAHANGNGNDVSMITAPGSSQAVFWDLVQVPA